MDDSGRDRISCIDNTPLNDIALIKAVDWEADEATEAHVRLCPYCADQVRELRQFQQSLRARLYRLFCPATDVLVDYYQGFLEIGQRTDIARHIAECPHCTHELELLMEDDMLAGNVARQPGNTHVARLSHRS